MSDSIHRIGLAVATLAVVVTVGGVFAVDGYVSAQASATSSLPAEIVYVRAARRHLRPFSSPRRHPRGQRGSCT